MIGEEFASSLKLHFPNHSCSEVPKVAVSTEDTVTETKSIPAKAITTNGSDASIETGTSAVDETAVQDLAKSSKKRSHVEDTSDVQPTAKKVDSKIEP